MSNFEIIKLNSGNAKILVVMKTSDAPFEFLYEIQEQLRKLKFSGIVLIDELLHSGNTNERFIKVYFNGSSFDNGSFCFENVDKRDSVRNHICEYLKLDNELSEYSCLTEKQQRLILSGCFI